MYESEQMDDQQKNDSFNTSVPMYNVSMDEMSGENLEKKYAATIQDMTLWQRFIRLFYLFFKKDELAHFYLSCAMNTIQHNLQIEVPGWYSSSTKELMPEFAQTLSNFVQGLAYLSPLMHSFVKSAELKQINIQKTPNYIEMLFHILYTRSDISSYPFSETQIYKILDNQPVDQAKKNIVHKVEVYLSSIPEMEYLDVNMHYTNLIYLGRCMDAPLADFLRRFRSDFQLDGSYTQESWSPLGITAAAHYLEILYILIEQVDIFSTEEMVFQSINTTLVEINQPTSLTFHDITDAWKNISTSITYFKENQRLLSLLKLARKTIDVDLYVDTTMFSLKQEFIHVLKTRINGLVSLFVKKTIKRDVNSVVQNIFPDSEFDIHSFEVGIFTLENSEKIQEVGGQGFHYVQVISLINLFCEHFYKPWLKSFLGSFIVNAHFTGNHVNEYVNKIREFTKFIVNFNKFAEDVGLNSSLGTRLTKLLNNPILGRSDKHFMDVFSDSINMQADEIVRQFQYYIDAFCFFIDTLEGDISTGKSTTVSNLHALKALQREGVLVSMHQLQNLFSVMDTALGMATQNKQFEESDW